MWWIKAEQDKQLDERVRGLRACGEVLGAAGCRYEYYTVCKGSREDGGSREVLLLHAERQWT